MSQMQEMEISLKGQTLTLFPQKAMLWNEQNMLIISDVHLGKSGHFRKHGIAIPKTVNETNIQKLEKLVEKTSPNKIIFLGDLFHSEINAELESFRSWRYSHAEIEMVLTLGNHDILTRFEYEKMGLQCVKEYTSEPFTFMHDEADKVDSLSYTITGHVHPAVKLKGKGRQQLYIPCYYFGETHCLMPAFGTFTGNHRINPAQNEKVYAIIEGKVFDVSSII